MNLRTRLLTLFSAAIVLTSCGDSTDNLEIRESTSGYSFSITNLNDTEYPDNPDIGFRATNYKSDYFTSGAMLPKRDAFIYDLQFFTNVGDTIRLSSIDLSEFIPTIPAALKEDHYLSYIACINQEWNRNQVKFVPGEFESTTSNLTRIDIARNCLNSYLWEIIVYVDEGGKTLPFAHGWFDFPHEQYASLFETKNGIPFDEFRDGMENWEDPASERINLDLLRNITDTIDVKYTDESDYMYPIAGAREKKFKEIIYPDSFSTMRDLQSDSTLFATFTPPGFYNRKDPRKTELGRIYTLSGAQLNEVTSSISNEQVHEIVLHFTHKKGNARTTLLLGGLHLDQFPVLSPENANSGWKSSMGIGNHTFYENYEEQLSTKTDKSPYYAMLLDEEGKWLDSHTIGIDGPIIHFSDEDRRVLHIWLLSFERHALVGHYILTM